MLGIFELCILSIFLIIVFVIVLIFLAMRKIKGGEFQHGDVNIILSYLAFHLQNRGWTPKIDPIKGKITVEKDSIVATDIYFYAQPDGRIEIYHGVNAAAVGWILVIVFIFFAALVGLIVAVVLHVMSRNFAKKEVIPFIMKYGLAPPPTLYPQYPEYFQPPL
jgi:hypothetical protein